MNELLGQLNQVQLTFNSCLDIDWQGPTFREGEVGELTWIGLLVNTSKEFKSPRYGATLIKDGML